MKAAREKQEGRHLEPGLNKESVLRAEHRELGLQRGNGLSHGLGNGYRWPIRQDLDLPGDTPGRAFEVSCRYCQWR